MSTRAQVRFATREDGVSFSEHPEKIHAQFYVHSDGYPEGLGLDIAESYMNYGKIAGWEIEPLNAKHGDLEYIYYIWQKPNDTTWISIFEDGSFPGYCKRCEQLLPSRLDRCIFVGTPEKLITKYKLNTNDDG
tara:strand:- start:14 stop:412 length:399 start_codon:yes stop_codon:yes gene_type:complete